MFCATRNSPHYYSFNSPQYYSFNSQQHYSFNSPQYYSCNSPQHYSFNPPQYYSFNSQYYSFNSPLYYSFNSPQYYALNSPQYYSFKSTRLSLINRYTTERNIRLSVDDRDDHKTKHKSQYACSIDAVKHNADLPQTCYSVQHRQTVLTPKQAPYDTVSTASCSDIP